MVVHKFKMTDEDTKIAQETDFMQNIITQRNQDINQIGDIMSNINDMAKDLATETKDQGDKLLKLDSNMGEAEKNADDALIELKSAANHSRKAGRCTKCLIWLILILVLGVGLIVYFVFIRGGDEK